jgi:alpha-galactosidase
MNNQIASVGNEEMEFLHAWIRQIICAAAESGGVPAKGADRHSEGAPFSFQCGARSSREWLKLEDAKIESGEWRGCKKIHHLRWVDHETSVSCEMELTEFQEFPAMEWVVRLRNEGGTGTEPISNFQALDIFWKCAKESEMPELRRSLGSDGRHDDFQYLCEEMRESAWVVPRTIRMDSANNNAFRKVRDGSPPCLLTDGRTSATWLPFFNLRTGGDGIISALGWTGQWFAEFAHDGSGRIDISAGMEHLELKLRPGEAIRSPRVLLLYWKGEPIHAHNVLRKFFLEFHSPHVDGKSVEMPICNGAWGGSPSGRHVEMLQAIAQHGLPYDYYWIDAGWYGTSEDPCPDVLKGKWAIVGDWRVNKNYHPNGLKPIRDAVHQAGMKFLLWVEAEKAMYGTPVTLEHPDWFLRKTKEEPKINDEMLLDLGNPEAWQWIVETVSRLIEENGMDCYRVDFNMDPSPYWRNAEEDGRKGMVEMRFVEGFYAFWDELRRRHSNLLIDNCASGGRRLDLETIGRSVALWRTDYGSSLNGEAVQAQSCGLNLWLPLNSTTPGARMGDTYQVRSALSSGLVLGLDEFGFCDDWKSPDFPWAWLRTRIQEAKRLRPYFYGDFYPLTPCVIHRDAWMAYQLLLPGKGAVVAFRRPESRMVSASFQLYDLHPESSYELEDVDSGKTLCATGNHLMTEGLEISMAVPRESRLLFYKKLPGDQSHESYSSISLAV